MQTFSLHDFLYSQQLHNLYNISIFNYQIYIFSLDFSSEFQISISNCQLFISSPSNQTLSHPVGHPSCPTLTSIPSVFFISENDIIPIGNLVYSRYSPSPDASACHFAHLPLPHCNITTLILPRLPPHPHMQTPLRQHSTVLNCLYPLAIWITAVISSLVFLSPSLGSEQGTLCFAATVIF